MSVEKIYDDGLLIAFNKPPSLPVQQDLSGDLSLWNISEQLSGKKIHFLTRLDRPVSGVVIGSVTAKMNKRLQKLQKSGNVLKKYFAFIEAIECKEKDKLTSFITKNSGTRKAICHAQEVQDSVPVELYFEKIKEFDRYILLKIELTSGKFHQIRAQLSHAMKPVKGDVKYGARRKNKNRSIHLHCFEISMIHPQTKKPLVIQASPPGGDPLWDLVKMNADI